MNQRRTWISPERLDCVVVVPDSHPPKVGSAPSHFSRLHFGVGQTTFNVSWGSYLSSTQETGHGRHTQHPVKGKGDTKHLCRCTARVMDDVQAFQTPPQ